MRASHTEAIEVVADILARLDDDAHPEAFYDQLCQAVCEAVDMERAVVFLYDGGLRRVRAVGSHGVDRASFREASVTADSAPVARAALEQDRVLDVGGDDEALALPERFAPLVRGRRLVCAPMVAAGRWIGVLLVDRPQDGPPLSDEGRYVLWTLGKAAALAATARIATRQSERARQLEHRIDLAREVHDGVIQRLFGVSLALAGTGALAAEERERCSHEVQAALGELRDALQRPLGREARDTGSTFAEEVGLLAAAHPDLLLEGDADGVPDHLEAVAQSALAEGVRNARKHAEVTYVAVRPGRTDGAFLLEVENDGVRDGAARSAGMGLRLLAFEALRLGGFVEFGPRDGGRWLLRLVVPLDG